MKILLIGKTGQLGGDILKNNQAHEIYAPDRDTLDVTSKSAFEALMVDSKPEVVINTAAFHNVPLCETDVEQAFRVNCAAVRDMAAACKKNGSLFINFSSDYVFGGEKRTPYAEEEKPQPLQMYGISRVAGEFAAMATAPDQTVIIRTCGLYGMSGAQSKGGNFVDKRVRDAGIHTVLEMGCDQVVSPTCSDDLSKAVLRLVEHPLLKPGIYHLVNEGACTWYEFTKAIYEIMMLDVTVKPIDRGGIDGGMRRPLYSVLANLKAKALGISLPHWRDSLKTYLQEKYH